MNISDTRVRTYLDDLARMLSDLDPGERDEVLAGIREHLDATLAEHPDDPHAMDAALLRLGPPERVATEARAGLPAAAPVRSTTSRGWLTTGLVLTLVTTIPFTMVAAVGRAGDLVDVGLGMSVVDTAVPMFFTWPLWLTGVVCVVVARHRAPSTWGVLVACGPICFATTAIATFWREPEALSTLISVALLLYATGLTVVTARSAWRESSA